MTASAYDPDNIFAKIIRGELPCHKVYEDADTLAFLDIMPRVDGHTLIIPKIAARNILDVPVAALTPLLATTQRIAQAAMTAFNAEGITLSQYSEAAGGQVIFHLHFHVMPRHDGVALRAPGDRADDALLAHHAEKLRMALKPI